MSTMSEGPNVPDTARHEVALGLVKAALSAVPVLGGPATELLDLVISPAIQRRKTDWLNDLADALADLQNRVDDLQIEQLAEDPLFVSTLLQASAVALREHHQEKLEALRNAVLNTAIGTSVEEDDNAMFISWIDSLTPWHLRLLRFLDAKEEVARQLDKLPFPSWSAGGVSTVLEHVYPELEGRRTMYDVMIRDLSSRGLATVDSLHATGTREGYMLARQSSDVGQRFLSFIAQPKELAHSPNPRAPDPDQ